MEEIDGKELLALRYLQRQKDTLATLKSALAESEKENAELKKQVELLAKQGTKKIKTKKLSAPKGKRAFILGLTDNHYTQQVDPTLSGGAEPAQRASCCQQGQQRNRPSKRNH